MTKNMSKFEVKAFECEILGELYNTLESRKTWFKRYNAETDIYEDSDDLRDIAKVSIIDDIMKRLEKML